MKKLLSISALILLLLCIFVSCNEENEGGGNQGGASQHTHSYTEWMITEKPTCTESGVKTRYCPCGEKQTEVEPELGHTPKEAEIEDRIEATYEKDGSYKEVVRCKNCNEKLSEKICVIPKHNHTPAEAVKENLVEATCYREGSYDSVVYCSSENCKAEISRTTKTIEVLKHNYVNGVCTRCNDKRASEGLSFKSNGDGTCTLIGIGTCTDKELIIPEISPEGDIVTCIGAAAFYSCNALTSVAIPDSVTSIGQYSFYGCSSLTSVVIGDGVTSINEMALTGCYKLVEVINHSSLDIVAGSLDHGNIGYYAKEVHTGESKIVNVNDYLFYTYDGANYLLGYVGTETDLVLPESYNGESYEIYDRAFERCASLTSVVIPNSVTSIGDDAFRHCSSLASVAIPDSVTSIGGGAFHECTSLTSVVIGDSVTSIGISAFFDCTNLTSIVIGDGVTSIGYSAFYYTGYYNDESNWKNGVLYIGKYLIDAKATISGEYIIKNGTKLIAAAAFEYCYTLTSVVIPDSVTSIGNYAFYDCRSLTSVVIPDGVTSIGDGVFVYCSSLTDIAIPDSVTSIGAAAFRHCYILTSVVIPDSVTNIGNYAFYDCRSLTSVVIPDSVTSIGESAFEDCTRLASIVIPDSVTSIGAAVFRHCYSLTSIVIPDSVTSIGQRAFLDCYKLVEVINHSSLHIEAGTLDYGYIGYYAIEVHTGVSKIVNYNDYLFYTYEGVNYLLGYVGTETDLVLPESYNGENYEIYNRAFYGCDNLTSVVIGDSVTSIGSYAFYSCDSLTSVVIGDSVTSIGESTFEDCTSLTSVVIPDSVTSIGDYAFAYCENLTSVVIPDSVVYIGENAFKGTPIEGIVTPA